MLRRLQPELASEDSREEFDHCLANLLQRLQAAVAGDEHYQQIGALRDLSTTCLPERAPRRRPGMRARAASRQ